MSEYEEQQAAAGSDEKQAVQLLRQAVARYDLSERVWAEFVLDPQRALRCLIAAESRKATSPMGLAITMFRQGEDPGAGREDAELELLVMRAEKWVRNAGMHFDRWEEVEEELFERGLGGGMRPSVKVPRRDDLVARLYGVWLAVRPIGEQLQADELSRAERWKEQQLSSRARARVRVGTRERSRAQKAPKQASFGLERFSWQPTD